MKKFEITSLYILSILPLIIGSILLTSFKPDNKNINFHEINDTQIPNEYLGNFWDDGWSTKIHIYKIHTNGNVYVVAVGKNGNVSITKQ